MKRFIIFILVSLSVSPFLFGQVFAWTGNPSGAYNAATFVCSADEQKMIIGTPESGYFQTNDGGETWEIFNPWLPHTVNRYYSVVTADANADTIFMSARSSTDLYNILFYSTNSGSTWNSYSEPDSIASSGERFVIIDHNNHCKILLFNPRGISISENCGETWDVVRIDSINYTVGSFIQDTQEINTFYSSGFYLSPPNSSTLTNRFIRKSTDGGITWQNVYDSDLLSQGDDAVSGMLNSMLILSDGSILGGGYNSHNHVMDLSNQLLLSSDNGVTGEWYSGGLPEGFYPNFLVEDPIHQGTVYTSGKTVFGLYRSTDYGETFSRCVNGLPMGMSKIDNLTSNIYNGKVYVSFYGNGVFCSSDGGGSWTRLPAPIIGGRSRFTVFENCIQMRNDGYVYKRYDFNSHRWYDINIPDYSPVLPSLFPIKFVDNLTLITGTRLYNPTDTYSYDIVSLRSDDNGDSWYEIGPHFTTQTSHYDVWNNDNVARFYSIQETDEGYQAIISYDSARSWINKSIIADISMNYPAPYQNENYLYAHIQGVLDGAIFRSVDDGDSFQNMDFPDNPNLLYLFDDDRLIVTVFIDNDRQKIYYYDGDEWHLQNEDEALNGNIVNIPGETDILLSYSTNSFGEHYLLISNNMGQTWQRRVLNIPYVEYKPFLGSLAYDPWRNLVWLSTGVGLCYIPFFDLNTEEGDIDLIPLDRDLIANYPNPFNSTTKLRFVLRNQGEVDIKLYNINGQMVKAVTSTNYEAGSHEIDIDLSGYSSGTYFVKMETVDGITTHKLQLVK